MGSLLGPVLGNIFISHFEQNSIDNLPLMFKIYYVDNTFLIFPNEADNEHFLDYMNTQPENI